MSGNIKAQCIYCALKIKKSFRERKHQSSMHILGKNNFMMENVKAVQILGIKNCKIISRGKILILNAYMGK